MVYNLSEECDGNLNEDTFGAFSTISAGGGRVEVYSKEQNELHSLSLFHCEVATKK